ncbi:hypothetical protein KAR91_52160 [Candidatus Pacearchaeota archaeon]|nr:hypothetical protein [Candidatus Pacearchaeota archaeon]
MSKKEDGGPAYPCKTLQERYRSGNSPAYDEVWDSGISLRDYFAGQASEEDIVEHQKDIAEGYSMSRERARYEYADAMIKERVK